MWPLLLVFLNVPSVLRMQCRTHLSRSVWATRSQVSVISSERIPFLDSTLHQMGVFSCCADRFRIFIGYQLCVSFCREKIRRWPQGTGPEAKMSAEWVIAPTDNCQCVEQWGWQSWGLQRNWFGGCLERMQISEAILGPHHGEQNCIWILRWLVQLQDTWQPAAQLLS